MILPPLQSVYAPAVSSRRVSWIRCCCLRILRSPIRSPTTSFGGGRKEWAGTHPSWTPANSTAREQPRTERLIRWGQCIISEACLTILYISCLACCRMCISRQSRRCPGNRKLRFVSPGRLKYLGAFHLSRDSVSENRGEVQVTISGAGGLAESESIETSRRWNWSGYRDHHENAWLEAALRCVGFTRRRRARQRGDGVRSGSKSAAEIYRGGGERGGGGAAAASVRHGRYNLKPVAQEMHDHDPTTAFRRATYYPAHVNTTDTHTNG